MSTITRRDAPPRLISQIVSTLRSARDSALRRTLVQTLPMRSGAITSVTVASGGAVASVRGATVVPATAFDLATTLEEFALTPERVLLTALDAPDLRLQRDTTLGGVAHHVVSLGVADAPVRLFIDAASGFPTRVELVRAYPTNVFWAMWGDLRLVTTWSSWAVDGGVWYPRQRAVSLNGAPFREYQVTALAIDPDISADSVAIPDSVRRAFEQRVRSELTAAARGGAPPVKPVEIADGVVLYEGGYQSTAVRQHDGVVIIEAPESAAKSRAVLADVGRRWPGLRVKAVVSTSPMWMHIGGLREYAARGVPIYALDVNVPVVQALLDAPHRQSPDSLARRPVKGIVRPVRDRLVIGSGDERLELVPARGQHASSMMLVWHPADRLLYASDIIVPDAFEPVFTAAYRSELERIVRREGLDVARVYSEHLPVATWNGGGR